MNKSRFFRFLPDKMYLKLKYFIIFKRKLNLKKPLSFNEKINWLKLYDRKNEYIAMVDKYEAKKYVSDIIGNKYIIDTLGIYDSFDAIDFKRLPNRFVIKCTHDSGGIVICKDKETFDINSAKSKIEKSLKNNYFYHAREWPYKNIKPRILIEKYMEDSKDKELRDYKFFCFNGEPKLMFIATDRSIHATKFNFYDMDFKLLPFKQHYPNDERKIEKPKKFDEMVNLAKKLSKNIPFVRVDFYEVNGRVYFGELTFSHFSGMMPFEPDDWDYKLGELLNIEGVKK